MIYAFFPCVHGEFQPFYPTILINLRYTSSATASLYISLEGWGSSSMWKDSAQIAPFPALTPTAKYTCPGTEASVRAFQRAQGLSADGVAGPMTLTALYEGTSPTPEPEITPAPDDPTPAPTAAPTAAPAPVSYATLRPGARGSAVSDLQQALRRLGYYRMTVDGVYGGGTAEAVRAFQRGCGLTADGIAGPKTLTALYGSPVSPTESTAYRRNDARPHRCARNPDGRVTW